MSDLLSPDQLSLIAEDGARISIDNRTLHHTPEPLAASTVGRPKKKERIASELLQVPPMELDSNSTGRSSTSSVGIIPIDDMSDLSSSMLHFSPEKNNKNRQNRNSLPAKKEQFSDHEIPPLVSPQDLESSSLTGLGLGRLRSHSPSEAHTNTGSVNRLALSSKQQQEIPRQQQGISLGQQQGILGQQQKNTEPVDTLVPETRTQERQNHIPVPEHPQGTRVSPASAGLGIVFPGTGEMEQDVSVHEVKFDDNDLQELDADFSDLEETFVDDDHIQVHSNGADEDHLEGEGHFEGEGQESDTNDRRFTGGRLGLEGCSSEEDDQSDLSGIRPGAEGEVVTSPVPGDGGGGGDGSSGSDDDTVPSASSVLSGSRGSGQGQITADFLQGLLNFPQRPQQTRPVFEEDDPEAQTRIRPMGDDLLSEATPGLQRHVRFHNQTEVWNRTMSDMTNSMQRQTTSLGTSTGGAPAEEASDLDQYLRPSANEVSQLDDHYLQPTTVQANETTAAEPSRLDERFLRPSSRQSTDSEGAMSHLDSQFMNTMATDVSKFELNQSSFHPEMHFHRDYEEQGEQEHDGSEDSVGYGKPNEEPYNPFDGEPADYDGVYLDQNGETVTGLAFKTSFDEVVNEDFNEPGVDFEDEEFVSGAAGLDLLENDEKQFEKENPFIQDEVFDTTAHSVGIDGWSFHADKNVSLPSWLSPPSGQSHMKISIGKFIGSRTEALGSLDGEQDVPRPHFGTNIITPPSNRKPVALLDNLSSIQESTVGEEGGDLTLMADDLGHGDLDPGTFVVVDAHSPSRTTPRLSSPTSADTPRLSSPTSRQAPKLNSHTITETPRLTSPRRMTPAGSSPPKLSSARTPAFSFSSSDETLSESQESYGSHSDRYEHEHDNGDPDNSSLGSGNYGDEDLPSKRVSDIGVAELSKMLDNGAESFLDETGMNLSKLTEFLASVSMSATSTEIADLILKFSNQQRKEKAEAKRNRDIARKEKIAEQTRKATEESKRSVLRPKENTSMVAHVSRTKTKEPQVSGPRKENETERKMASRIHEPGLQENKNGSEKLKEEVASDRKMMNRNNENVPGKGQKRSSLPRRVSGRESSASSKYVVKINETGKLSERPPKSVASSKPTQESRGVVKERTSRINKSRIIQKSAEELHVDGGGRPDTFESKMTDYLKDSKFDKYQEHVPVSPSVEPERFENVIQSNLDEYRPVETLEESHFTQQKLLSTSQQVIAKQHAEKRKMREQERPQDWLSQNSQERQSISPRAHRGPSWSPEPRERVSESPEWRKPCSPDVKLNKNNQTKLTRSQKMRLPSEIGSLHGSPKSRSSDYVRDTPMSSTMDDNSLEEFEKRLKEYQRTFDTDSSPEMLSTRSSAMKSRNLNTLHFASDTQRNNSGSYGDKKDGERASSSVLTTVTQNSDLLTQNESLQTPQHESSDEPIDLSSGSSLSQSSVENLTGANYVLQQGRHAQMKKLQDENENLSTPEDKAVVREFGTRSVPTVVKSNRGVPDKNVIEGCDIQRQTVTSRLFPDSHQVEERTSTPVGIADTLLSSNRGYVNTTAGQVRGPDQFYAYQQDAPSLQHLPGVDLYGRQVPVGSADLPAGGSLPAGSASLPASTTMPAGFQLPAGTTPLPLGLASLGSTVPTSMQWQQSADRVPPNGQLAMTSLPYSTMPAYSNNGSALRYTDALVDTSQRPAPRAHSRTFSMPTSARPPMLGDPYAYTTTHTGPPPFQTPQPQGRSYQTPVPQGQTMQPQGGTYQTPMARSHQNQIQPDYGTYVTPSSMQSLLATSVASGTQRGIDSRLGYLSNIPPVINRPTPTVDVAPELRIPGVCCVGVSSRSQLVLGNPTDRWLQCVLNIVSLDIDGHVVEGSDQNPFVIKNKTIIAPKSSENISVLFAPRLPGVYIGQIHVISSLVVSDRQLEPDRVPAMVTLQAVAEEPNIQVLTDQAQSLDFGHVPYNSRKSIPITLLNRGRANVPVRLQISASGSSWHCFSFDADRSADISVISQSQRPVTPSLARSIINMTLKGMAENSTHVEPVQVMVYLKAPSGSFEKGAYTQGFPHEVLSARLDVEVDTPRTLCPIAGINITAVLGRARLHVSKSVEQGTLHASPGQSATQAVPLRNAGNINFLVSLSIPEDSCGFTVLPSSLTIKAGEEEEAVVKFTPKEGTGGIFESVLVMFIEPDGPAYELNLRGKVVTRAVQLVQPNNGDVGQEGVSYNSGEVQKGASYESSARTAGPVAEHSTRPGDLAAKPGGLNISSDKHFLVWGGVAVGDSRHKEVSLMNGGRSSLKLRLQIRESTPEFKIQSSYGQQVSLTHSREIIIQPGQKFPVHIWFSPSTVTCVTTKLQIKPTVGTRKFSIPLTGYGGVSQLLVEPLKTLDLGSMAVHERRRACFTVTNTGVRAAYVRAMCTTPGKHIPHFAKRMIVEPQQFVLDKNETRTVAVALDVSDREAAICSESQCCVGLVNLYYGDEVMRNNYKRDVRKYGVRGCSASDSLLHGIEFHIPFDNEGTISEASVPPSDLDVKLFYDTMSVVSLQLIGQPPDILEPLIPDETGMTEYFEQNTTMHATSFNGCSHAPVAPAPPPVHNSPPQKGTPAVKTKISSPHSSEHTSWVIRPEQIILSGPEPGSIDIKSLDKFVLINMTDRKMTFYLSWPGHYIKVTPGQGAIQPRESVMLCISPSLSLKPDELPWSGRVDVDCDGVRKVLPVQIRQPPEPPNSASAADFMPLTDIKTLEFPDTAVQKFKDVTMELKNVNANTVNWRLVSSEPAYVKLLGQPLESRATYSVFHITQKSGSLKPKDTEKISTMFYPSEVGQYTQTWDLNMEIDGAVCNSQQIKIFGKALPNTGSIQETARPAGSESAGVSSHGPITVRPTTVHFPPTSAGESSTIKVQVRNKSDTEYQCEIVGPQNPFHCKYTSIKSRERHFVSFPVQFKPKTPGLYQSVLVLWYSGGRLSITVHGECKAQENRS